MALTSAEFDAGLDFWQNSTRWPRDLHNGFYRQLEAEQLPGDFSTLATGPFVGWLLAWKAVRPLSRAEIASRLAARAGELSAAWQACDAGSDEDIVDVAWSEVAAFTAVVASIKGARTPVFTSKFCHFIAPKTFPVIDTKTMGQPYSRYGDYFRAVQEEWAATDDAVRGDLEVRLREQVAAPLVQSFPVTNKIAEVCLIGRHRM